MIKTLPPKLPHPQQNAWQYDVFVAVLIPWDSRYSSFNWQQQRLLPPGVAFSKELRPTSNRWNNVTGLRQVILAPLQRSYNDTCLIVLLRCPHLYNNNTSDSPSNFLNWEINPVYYLFNGCQCSDGFNLVNLSTRTFVSFNCTKIPRETIVWWESCCCRFYHVLVFQPTSVHQACRSWLLFHVDAIPFRLEKPLILIAIIFAVLIPAIV